ncbi:MAG TPA: cell division protein FtsA [Candidatus Kapabacteria bacterium]|nr:cell division protein FtsA [Candidatus Kapabacteria bacterium]
MMKKKHVQMITGIDIGSTAMRVVVGQCAQEDGRQCHIQILGAIEVPSSGVHKGAVTSIEETVSSLSHALEQTERLVGVPIEHAWIGISGPFIQIQQSKGVIAVAKADGEISPEDVGRALEAARTVAPPLNYEVLHVLPKSYTVDGQSGIKDPIGMTGIRMEVDVQLIHGATAQLKNITKAVYRTGIDIDDLVLSILATGDVVTTSRQRELGTAVINMGGSTTSLAVYEEGDLLHTAIIPIGSEHITNDLAIGLRTSIDVAERVKLEWGHCDSDAFTKKDIVDLFDAGAEYHENISRQYISEIVGARVLEILEKIDQELVRVGRSGLLPAGVIFTGGGAKIQGLVPYAKDVLRLPATLGYPIDLSSATEKAQDIAFATVVGLVKWAALLNEERGGASSLRFTGANKMLQKMKEFAKSLIP